MARFGKNWGQPFGAFKTSEFQGVFYYEGFTDTMGRSAFSYSMVTSNFVHTSGVSEWSGFICATTSPDKAILTGPMDTGDPLSGDVYITWVEANPRDFDFTPVTYQIQYTDQFDDNKGWVDITSGVEQGNTSYVWNVRQIPKSKNIGLRMRAVDLHQNASEWDTLPDAFTIDNHAPSEPTLLTPLEKEIFDERMLITWDAVNVSDFDGDKIFYKLEYTANASGNENWQLISDGIPFGVTQYEFETLNLSDGDDYGIRISALDEFGAQSDYSRVGDLTIFHHSIFIIDTTPPTGTLVINNNSESTLTRDVHLTLNFNDDTTEVKDFRFINIDPDTGASDDDFGDFIPAAIYRYWRLQKDDGIKRVGVQFRDYANNVTQPVTKKGVFRKFTSDSTVTSLASFVDSLWMGQVSGKIHDLQTISALLHELEVKVNSMVELGGKMYIGTEKTDTTGTVYIADRYSSAISIDFTEIDSKVNSVEKFDLAFTNDEVDNYAIFAGLENGKIYMYTADAWTLNFTADDPIQKIYNSGNQLFALTDSLEEYLVYDPILNTWDTRTIVNI